MPMPHRTFAQVARRRLVGKEGRERIRVISHGPKNDTGGDLLASQESYDAIIATLDSIPLLRAGE